MPSARNWRSRRSAGVRPHRRIGAVPQHHCHHVVVDVDLRDLGCSSQRRIRDCRISASRRDEGESGASRAPEARASYTNRMSTVELTIDADERSCRASDASSDADFVLAHLSDLHLSSLEGVRARALLDKRILGYLSWRHRRRREHRTDVLDALRADLARGAPRSHRRDRRSHAHRAAAGVPASRGLARAAGTAGRHHRRSRQSRRLRPRVVAGHVRAMVGLHARRRRRANDAEGDEVRFRRCAFGGTWR